jgi:hypothetical protein
MRWLYSLLACVLAGGREIASNVLSLKANDCVLCVSMIEFAGCLPVFCWQPSAENRRYQEQAGTIL